VIKKITSWNMDIAIAQTARGAYATEINSLLKEVDVVGAKTVEVVEADEIQEVEAEEVDAIG